MKHLKKIIVWAMLSLFIQLSGLFYLDKFYFINETSFKEKKVDVAAKKKASKADIKIPEKAINITTSYDGKYLAYFVGETLKVLNTDNGEEKNVQLEDAAKVSYYKWLPDVNSIIIAEKYTSNKGDYLMLTNYDVAKNKKKDIKDERNGESGHIYLPDKKSEVEDIELSTLTNIIYVKIGHNGGKNALYSINVMGQMEKKRINSYVTGNFVIFPHEDKLAYDDLTYHKVYVTGVQGAINIKGVTRPTTIAVDSDDRLYIGQTEGEKIKKIFFGTIKESTDNWKSIDLKVPAERKDIYVSEDGKVYANDNLRGVVTDLGTGMETSYKGEFLQMYNGGIASKTDNIVYKTPLK